MSTTASHDQAVSEPADHIELRPLYNCDIRIDDGNVLVGGCRRVPGDPVSLACIDDSAITAHTARRLAGHLLHLHLETEVGQDMALQQQTLPVSPAVPAYRNAELTVWPINDHADVVHVAPSLGWVATTTDLDMTDATPRMRLIQALAALARELDHDNRIARQAVHAARSEWPSQWRRYLPAGHVLDRIAVPEAIGPARAVLLSAPLLDQIRARLNDGQPAAHAAFPNWNHDPEFRLTLWPDLGNFAWLLVHETARTLTATGFNDTWDAVLAFEQLLVLRDQEGETHTVTRSPWRLWTAARTQHIRQE